MRNVVLSICFLVASVRVHAQQDVYVAESPLPKVSADGFYTIDIPVDATAYLTPGFANLRLLDKHGKEVPYLVSEERPVVVEAQFEPYEILEKKYEPGCCTSLVLHNPKLNALNAIHLIFKNAEATKQAVLLGSDDRAQWYALKQNFVFATSPSTSGTSEVRIVDFPLTNYRYYKLNINDSSSAPLNITSAGYMRQLVQTASYTRVPIARVRQVDSLAHTYVYLHFDQPRMVDKLELTMKGAPFFLRSATLYEQRQRTNKTGEAVTYYDALEDVQLNSRHATTMAFHMAKPSTWLLVIDNGNNPALQVEDVKAFQLRRTITAHLKMDESYTAKFGTDDMPAHRYDLAYFRDSLPQPAGALQLGGIAPVVNESAATSPVFFTNKVFIWAAVIVVIGVLAFMSVRMLNETAPKKDRR